MTDLSKHNSSISSSNLTISNDTFISRNEHSSSVNLSLAKRKAWTANISKQFRFSNKNNSQIQLNTKSIDEQFNALVTMLKANNCSKIFIDMPLNKEHKQVLTELAGSHQTQVINIKQALITQYH